MFPEITVSHWYEITDPRPSKLRVAGSSPAAPTRINNLGGKERSCWDLIGIKRAVFEVPQPPGHENNRLQATVPLSSAVHAETRHAGWSSNLRCGPVWVRHVRSLFLSPRNCSAEYIALHRRMVTSHQSEGTVERGSQKPLSKMLGRRCSAFSAARAPGLVHDRDQERAVPLPGLQAPFLPVCWQTVPVHIQSGLGDGTGGVRDRLTEIGDDYIALADRKRTRLNSSHL